MQCSKHVKSEDQAEEEERLIVKANDISDNFLRILNLLSNDEVPVERETVMESAVRFAVVVSIVSIR